jgi:hypothetical protein
VLVGTAEHEVLENQEYKFLLRKTAKPIIHSAYSSAKLTYISLFGTSVKNSSNRSDISK